MATNVSHHCRTIVAEAATGGCRKAAGRLLFRRAHTALHGDRNSPQPADQWLQLAITYMARDRRKLHRCQSVPLVTGTESNRLEMSVVKANQRKM